VLRVLAAALLKLQIADLLMLCGDSSQNNLLQFLSSTFMAECSQGPLFELRSCLEITGGEMKPDRPGSRSVFLSKFHFFYIYLFVINS
jgi:hypothetical protein